MLGERRRRRRPTPREPTLSLAELLDASTRPPPVRLATARAALADKDEDKSSSREKQTERSARGKSRPSRTADAGGKCDPQQPAKVVVTNVVSPDEVNDPGERLDVEEELRALLSRHGRLESLRIDDAACAVTAAFPDLKSAKSAVLMLDGSVYESRTLSARLDASSTSSSMDKSRASDERSSSTNVGRKRSKRRSRLKCAVARERARRRPQQRLHSEDKSLGTSLIVRNLLDPEELEDDDEAEDVSQEVRDRLAKYGEVESVEIVRAQAGDLEVGSIVVKYGQVDAATKALEFYNGRVFGGRRVECEWVGQPVEVKVVGVVDPEELGDPDEFQDVLAEVNEYFAGFKQVVKVESVRESGDCIVQCGSEEAATEFIDITRASKYGGRLLEACRVELEPAAVEKNSATTSQPRQETPLTSTAAVTELAITLLQRLASLQERSHVQNPLQDKRSRRLVLGLHEVRRGISQQKIKLLVVGTDLEDVETIRDAVNELVTAAGEQGVPVIHPMNRRRLGRVLKKSVRVSCVGVYSVDGANDIFKQLLASI